VRFTWDLHKSDVNVERRGFDFMVATLIFDGRILERDDVRSDYGERRVVAIGVADGRHLTVVYTDRHGELGAVRRIISARRSNERERREYEKTFASEA
jgi:uncharacterized DUF497 family protein